ncbi:DNA excision repair protein ERCC-1 [Aegotheles albertisi]
MSPPRLPKPRPRGAWPHPKLRPPPQRERSRLLLTDSAATNQRGEPGTQQPINERGEPRTQRPISAASRSAAANQRGGGGRSAPVPSLFRPSGAPPEPPPGPRPYAEFGGGGAAPPGPETSGDPPGDPPGPAPLPALPLLKPGARSSSIVVSPRQRGNPVLRFVRNVPWEFGDIVPDYVLGQSTCALFLSLRYHHLHPGYLHSRLQELGRSFALQLLLLQVDVKDPQQALKDLAKICILADCTLLLAWSPEEAGRYLETFKAFEQKPPDLLKERVDQDFLSRMTDCITSVKAVNRTDVLSLLSTFGSLAAVVGASREDLSLCPGVGPQKARRLFEVLHEPFRKVPK